MCEARNNSKADWVSCHRDDGNCAGGRLELKGHWSPAGVDQVRIGCDGLAGDGCVAVGMSLGVVAIDDDVLALDDASPFQFGIKKSGHGIALQVRGLSRCDRDGYALLRGSLLRYRKRHAEWKQCGAQQQMASSHDSPQSTQPLSPGIEGIRPFHDEVPEPMVAPVANLITLGRELPRGGAMRSIPPSKARYPPRGEKRQRPCAFLQSAGGLPWAPPPAPRLTRQWRHCQAPQLIPVVRLWLALCLPIRQGLRLEAGRP